jgi:hypothetical protein
MKHVPLMLYSLSGIASLLAEEGKASEALELFAFVEQHPQTPVNYVNLVRQRSLDIETRLPQEALSAARVRGATIKLDTIVKAVLRDPSGGDPTVRCGAKGHRGQAPSALTAPPAIPTSQKKAAPARRDRPTGPD